MTRTRVWAAVWVVLPLAAAGSCQHATKVSEPLTTQLAGNDAEAQLAFWHSLSERKITSNDEAFHGLLLFLDGKDSAADYASRVEQLKSRGVLPAKFNRPAEEAVNRGTMAVAIVAVLDIKGGLTLRLFPHSPRYATRELQYIGLYPRSSPHQAFSGSEFLGIIGRAEDYERMLSGRTSAMEELTQEQIDEE
ncbi:MAG: hypothetical protein QGH33_05495 [Pirellulaceae bacterium]|nr:hypothetical protein [Pirellulaceae bacterium]